MIFYAGFLNRLKYTVVEIQVFILKICSNVNLKKLKSVTVPE